MKQYYLTKDYSDGLQGYYDSIQDNVTIITAFSKIKNP